MILKWKKENRATVFDNENLERQDSPKIRLEAWESLPTAVEKWCRGEKKFCGGEENKKWSEGYGYLYGAPPSPTKTNAVSVHHLLAEVLQRVQHSHDESTGVVYCGGDGVGFAGGSGEFRQRGRGVN
ncbi:hypothetical protein CIPAW_16G060900 [Carya illinoinensis]|uniref:Uncharacterized protein n=1 Tax=Carya illinoinensis TaxID=32201 RepID=A0A8T1N7B9_CARIL|nr:hypothetical protein CIPAW_16G060900 [Carya illinoinensis]